MYHDALNGKGKQIDKMEHNLNTITRMYIAFIEAASEMCREKWTQFNMLSMILGLILLFLSCVLPVLFLYISGLSEEDHISLDRDISNLE